MNEEGASLLRPQVALPFLLVCMIWGSTWWVITGQLGQVPTAWAVTYRFAMATPAMFAVALGMRKSLSLGMAGHRLALMMGALQFCGNYNFVYLAEEHLTSGIVAVMISLMLVPNAVLARLWLSQPVTKRFLQGSAIAIAGIALLLIHEARDAPMGGGVISGIVFAVIAMLCASFANVMQANETGRSLPMVSLLAWAMLYGTLIDAVLASFTVGAPVIPRGSTFWWGTAYLAFAGSVVTFPLYYTLVRQLGPGRAAYNGVAVVVVAMLISTVFEGYRWTLIAGLGAALATAGLVVALSARRPAAKSG